MRMRIATLSLLTICCLLLAVSPAMGNTLYDNGPLNGTTDAWTVNFGFSVSDSAVLPDNSTITEFHWDCWNASSTDLLTSIDFQIGSTSFGGSVQTLTNLTNVFLGTNQFGYNLYADWFTFAGIPWSGQAFVTLSNACTTSGCSVSNPIYWDENSGAGCQSPGCPSTAYENTIGSIPSEAFTLTGTTGTSTVPEPSSIMLFGSGILGLAGVLRRRLNR